MLKRFIQKHIYGILGTIIFHMVVLIIILIVRISDLKPYKEASIFIDFEDTEEKLIEQIKAEKKVIDELNEYFNNRFPEEIRKNIAVNVAENEEFIKEGAELHKKAMELKKNVSDQLYESKEQLIAEDEENIQYEEEKNRNEKNTIYKGPTNITYYLKGRDHVWLPIPVYKCEGSGTVVVAITVNQQGRVENVEINTEESKSTDECLYIAARTYALKTKFNVDIKAPELQEGIITYHFVSQ